MSGSRAPGVFIGFVDPPPAVAPDRIDVPALVCVTERGPLNTPTRVGSWAGFRRVFGDGFGRPGLGGYAAKAFFDNGGGPAWIVRVAAPERLTTTVGVQPADRLTSVLASLDGFVVGAVATVSDADASRNYLVTSVDPTTSSVGWDRPLHPDLSLASPLDVATGAGRAWAALPGPGGTPALNVSASSPGAWGERLEVTCTADRRATTPNRLDQAGSPLVTPVVTTTDFRDADSCRISQDVAGVVTVIDATVAGVDHAGRVLTWEAPLVGIDPTLPFVIESVAFGLAVLQDGAVVEVWPDLSVHPAHARNASTLLASSAYVTVESLGTFRPAAARVRLAGGRDGTAALRISDLIGDELLADGRGLAALLDIDEPGVIAVPDLVAPATPPRVVQPPPPVDPCDPCTSAESVPQQVEAVVVEAGATFGYEAIVAAQQAVIESCERNTERVVLLDPPQVCRTLADLRGWAGRFSSSYAVTIAPWVSVVEPMASSAVRLIPASGHLAGLIARCDRASGPWQSPANRELVWAHGLASAFTEDEAGVANDAGLNLIRALPGRGLVPMGSRTLSPDSLWTFVAVRRTMIFLRRTLRHHLAWVVFEPNGPALASLLTGSISTLLTDLWDAGALAGTSPDEAFALAIDGSRASTGELLILVGVALARPAEFVIVRVSKTDNRLELVEQPQLVTAGG